MPPRPRVGFHDFLNSKPLLHAFRHGLVETPFDLVIDTPSALAERFRQDDLDIALIPSIEYAREPEAVIIPSVCIASLGKVETVLLFSDMAMEDVESVAVDPKSRTSEAMLRILFKEKYGKEPQITREEEEPELMLRDADAGLVIGDGAFKIDPMDHVVHDMGELWYQLSGRPFVHAVLCCKRGKTWDAAIASIEEAKAQGLAHRELIAKQETSSPQEAENLLEYLTSRIFYDLGPEEQNGLKHFLELASGMGLAPRTDLEFYAGSR